MSCRRSLIMLPLMWLALAGCSENTPENRQDDPRIEQGAALFQQHCSECHPRSGRGDYLKRIPATLLTRRSEQELVDWIQGSDKHREMPGFTHLAPEERAALAAFLLSQIQPARP